MLWSLPANSALTTLPSATGLAMMPASPPAGQTIYETDTGTVLQRVGSSWEILTEPPQLWTVSVFQGATQLATTTTYGWVQRSRGIYRAHAAVTLGTGSAGQTVLVSTPYTLVHSEAGGGTFHLFDSGNTNYVGKVSPFATTSHALQRDGVATVFGSGYTAAAADILRLDLWGRYA